MVAVQDRDAARRADGPRELLAQERAEELGPHEADALAARAAVLHHVQRRARHGVAGDEHELGVVGVRGGEAPGGPPPEHASRTRRPPPPDLRHRLHGVLDVLALALRVARPRHPAVDPRVVPPDAVRQVERRQEGVDLLLVRQVDVHQRVREHEAVLRHEGRQQHARVLRDAKREQDGVDEVLVRLAVELQHGGVAQRQAVALVDPDVPRRAERAVGGDQDDRQAVVAGGEHVLGHVEQAVGGAGREGAGAGDGRADADAHGAVLGLHRHDVALGERVGRQASP